MFTFLPWYIRQTSEKQLLFLLFPLPTFNPLKTSFGGIASKIYSKSIHVFPSLLKLSFSKLCRLSDWSTQQSLFVLFTLWSFHPFLTLIQSNIFEMKIKLYLSSIKNFLMTFHCLTIKPKFLLCPEDLFLLYHQSYNILPTFYWPSFFFQTHQANSHCNIFACPIPAKWNILAMTWVLPTLSHLHGSILKLSFQRDLP